MLPSAAEIAEAVGLGVLVPAAVAVVVLLLALRLGGGEPLGVGAGLAAGFAALAAMDSDWGFLRPAESWDWLPALGLLAVVVATAERGVKAPAVVRWAVRAVAAGLTAFLLVRAQSSRDVVPSWCYGALALAVLVLWGLLDLAVTRRPGGLVPALLTVVAFAAAGLGEMGGFLTVAQRAGVVAAALVGWAFVAWWRPLPAVCRAGVGVFAVLLPAALFVAAFNRSAEVPTASYLLLLVAPLALGAMSLLQLGPSSWRRAAVLAAVTLLPVAVSLILAARAGLAGSSDYS
ncbi:MAG TPA: hypothetical protein VFW33_02630 [Gemmataceae bacterium]|nr:hypothetical protein [Gemmataceae bacterium]